MKKYFAIFSTILCLAVSSEGFSYQQAPVYSDQCVGQCVEPCVVVCEPSCGNFYVGAFGGANWLNMHKLHGVRMKSKVGFTGALAVGYAFGNGIRVEGEVAYRRNHVEFKAKDFVFGSENAPKAHGHIQSWSYMANFLFDFDQANFYIPHVVPYVGFGLGYARNHGHAKAHYNSYEESEKSKGHGFAYQGIAGIGYRLTDTSTVGVEYRYFACKDHLRDHSVGVSFRQAF